MIEKKSLTKTGFDDLLDKLSNFDMLFGVFIVSEGTIYTLNNFFWNVHLTEYNKLTN